MGSARCGTVLLLVCGGGSHCAGGGVPPEAVPTLSWWGEVFSGVKHSIILYSPYLPTYPPNLAYLYTVYLPIPTYLPPYLYLPTYLPYL